MKIVGKKLIYLLRVLRLRKKKYHSCIDLCMLLCHHIFLLWFTSIDCKFSEEIELCEDLRDEQYLPTHLLTRIL